MKPVERIVLIGLSGVGKSSVGRQLADRLGWTVVDTDAGIEASFGLTIPDIFGRHGEAAFRERERSVLLQALARQHVVIACGGGAVTDPALWTPAVLGRPDTLVVALDATPETSLRRLVRQQETEGAAVERPLLADRDPLPRLVSMKAGRQATYDQADLTIVTDGVSHELAAREIEWVAQLGGDLVSPSVELHASSGDSAISIAPGCITALGHLLRERWPRAQRIWVITDDVVGPLHGAAVSQAIKDAGFAVNVFPVPDGESSKSLRQVSRLYDWLLQGGVERGDVVVALGGGVVGDLGGFVAATALRGVGLVQVPTTLLAMVDSSVGGKTGIDHPAGKNLIGAFYQPPLVIIDPVLLRTLPDRQIANGMAEIVKHAIIQPSTPGGDRADLLTFLERNQTSLSAGSFAAMSYLIRRNIALKAAVVAADEREAGIRAFLNFGHTLGHAIEAAGYTLLHGEAIAVGMRAEAAIAAAMDLCSPQAEARIAATLDRYDLPATSDADPDTVLALLGSDKKRAAGKLRWVLPVSAGGVTIRDDVPAAIVKSSLQSVTVSTGAA